MSKPLVSILCIVMIILGVVYSRGKVAQTKLSKVVPSPSATPISSPIAQPTPTNSPTMMTEMVMPATDKEFLELMIPHHEEAVQSSFSIASQTKNMQVKALAQSIIKTQNSEIGRMKDWYKGWFKVEYKDTGMYKPMMPDVSKGQTAVMDAFYLAGMIAHHKQAVLMAQSILVTAEKAEIKKLAKDIIASQTKQVTVMEKMLESQGQ